VFLPQFIALKSFAAAQQIINRKWLQNHRKIHKIIYRTEEQAYEQ
jgi:hypothetical protein